MKVTVLKNNQPLSEFSWPDTEIDEGFEAFIGRSEDCHVRIEDPLVSRHLLVIRFEQSHWAVERLSELGRLTYNGEPMVGVKEAHVSDVIVFAQYSIILTQLPEIKGHVTAVQPDSTAPVDALDSEMPPLEELDETAMLARTQARPTQSFPTDDLPPIGESLTQTIPDDDPLGLTDKGSKQIRGHAMDDLGFGEGDEQVIGSNPQENQNQSDSEPSSEDFGSDSTQADGGYNSESSSEEGGYLADSPAAEPTSTQLLQRFVNFELQLFGEYAPYDVYKVEDDEIRIGRDSKKCQIVLNDTEVSSVHAILRKTPMSLSLEDQNSSNGTILNGQRINKSELTNGDEFIVGSTTFTVRVSSDLIEAESGRLMPVERGQVIERIEEIEEEVPLEANALDLEQGPPEKSIIKRILKDPKKKRILIGAAVALLVLSLLEEEQSAPKPPPKVVQQKPAAPPKPGKRILSPEEIQALEARFKIAEAYVREKKLDEALAELEQIIAVDGDFKNVKTLYKFVQEQNVKLKEEQERLKIEEAKAKIREQVKGLLEEAKTAVAERNVTRAEQLFTEILGIDPENLEVTPLKQDLEAWQLQQKLEAEAKARKEAERKRMVDSLTPGKTLYLRKEWYKASVKLDEFLQIKQMDEDLVKEASDMLADARTQLAAEIAPLLGKARSLKEGQDLKGAYEAYLEVLRIDPINAESLDQVDSIREVLNTRSKKVYREAIISESLSLFSDAKEKLQEVQQISPTDSEYYKKASEKLKDYLE